MVKHVLEGHDRGVNCAIFHPNGGIVIFKLERKRSAHALSGNILYYVKKKCLRKLASRDTPVMQIRKLQRASTPRKTSRVMRKAYQVRYTISFTQNFIKVKQ